MGLEMVQPRWLIHPFAHLHEQQKILGAQIELSGWALEIKAAVLRQFTFGILPSVPAAFYGAGCNLNNLDRKSVV